MLSLVVWKVTSSGLGKVISQTAWKTACAVLRCVLSYAICPAI